MKRDFVVAIGGFHMSELLTVGQIAARLDEPVERVRYFIAHKRIKPVRRAGIVRLFDPDVVPIIKEACFNMQIRRGQL